MTPPTPPGLPPQGPPQMPPPMPPGPPQQQYGPPQQPYQQPYMPQQAQPPKKSNVLMWVLIGVGGLFLLVVLAIGAGSFFLYRTVKNAGFDADLMRNNPGLAMAKMVTALNPDTEVVSTNDSAGTVVVREKSTGKVMTMRFDPDKKTMVIAGDDGKEVTFKASGDGKNGGTLDITSPDGNIKFGAAAGNATPAWLPVYPGSAPQGTLSTQTPQGSQNTYAFKSQDPPSKIMSYYQDQLKSAGFTVNLTGSSDQGGMVQASDASKNRNVVIIAGASGEGTSGTITVVEK